MSLRDRLRRWFFRRQLPEPGTIELRQNRIYILPTRTGGLFALVLLLMYVGAVNYNLGLGHALVFLLIGLSLTGMLHTFRNLVGLRLRPGRVAPVFTGETATFEVLVENLGDGPRSGIVAQIFGPNATSTGGIPLRTDLMSNEVVSLSFTTVATQRGILNFERLKVSSQYPLGLFCAWSYPWLEMHCLVFPAPIFLPLPAPRGSDHASGGQSSPADGQEDFAGFRRHQPGDSLRHVAWKVHARDATESPLLVKEFTGAGVFHYRFDWELTPSSNAPETRLSTLCGWVLQAQQQGFVFGMRIPGAELPPGQGELHVAKALEALALFGAER